MKVQLRSFSEIVHYFQLRGCGPSLRNMPSFYFPRTYWNISREQKSLNLSIRHEQEGNRNTVSGIMQVQPQIPFLSFPSCVISSASLIQTVWNQNFPELRFFILNIFIEMPTLSQGCNLHLNMKFIYI